MGCVKDMQDRLGRHESVWGDPSAVRDSRRVYCRSDIQGNIAAAAAAMSSARLGLQAFDQDGSGGIEMKEMVLGLTAAMEGSLADKVHTLDS